MLKWTQTERLREGVQHTQTRVHLHTDTVNSSAGDGWVGGWGAELVVAHRSISGSSDKILCSYTSELQMMQCWEREGGGCRGGV